MELVNIDDVNTKVIDVPHLSQFYSWDCGLACCSMIFKYFNVKCDNLYTKDVEYLQCGQSVWTIHLAYLMKRYNIKHQMYTITLGVNQQFESKTFYSSFFSIDEGRVNELFNTAEENGVLVEKRSLTLKEILNQIESTDVAVCLVDWCKLECIWCSKKSLCFCCFEICPTSYQGHFIVICGYDKNNKYIYYKNPNTRQEEMCCSRFAEFDKARKSFGTDEDILFISSKQPDSEADS